MRVFAHIAALALVAAGWSASAAALSRHSPVPGGVAVVELPVAGDEAPQAQFAGKPVLVLRQGERWRALVGLPIGQSPGSASLAWRQGGRRGEVAFAVEGKDYPTQALKVPPKFVEPDPPTLERIARERQQVEAVKARFTAGGPPPEAFIAPAAGPLSSRFGLRRVFNDQPRSPHLGLDIAAPAGTPVRAPAAGTVVDVGDYFFWGRLVALDHGYGLITLYAHLSQVAVAPGQRLAQGELLGAVGATGRVTGAHLHWTVVLNGNSVDPELFLPLPMTEMTEK
jgi:murein DD-endopeptidase MepM/ murein hydrolase activator NlpD